MNLLLFFVFLLSFQILTPKVTQLTTTQIAHEVSVHHMSID